MADPELKTCQYCGGTGERYEPGLQGDGWMGDNCPFCEGYGVVLWIDNKSFPLAGNGSVYRARNGRFARIPEVGIG